MKRNLLCFLTILFTIISVQAQTNVPALITSNQIWDLAGSPYIIGQISYIDTGVSVKVMPGVEVLSQDKYKIIVDGEFQVLGKSDSIVLLDKLQLDYRASATSYNSATGEGAFISYGHFTGAGSAKFTVSLRYLNARVENTKFTNTYYGIYSISSADSSVIEVDGCSFIDSTGFAYPIYTSGTYSTIDVKNSHFVNGSSIYAYGNIIFENNIVDGLDRVYFTAYQDAIIGCNTFKNIKNSVELRLSSRDTNSIVSFTDNTIDSTGNSTFYPMMSLSKISSTYFIGQFTFTGNNFLTNKSAVAKLEIYGSNNSPSSFEYLDMRDNYWGSTDSATIASYITDYTDDITIFGKADVSTYLGQENTSCGSNSSTCTASFYLAVDTSSIFNLYVINNSTGTTSTTEYLWTFGDGDSSTSQTPTHTYSDFGLYNLCLTLTDTANGCSSTYCDSMGLDSNGTLLKNEGFNIIILNESDLLNIVELSHLYNLNVYPNPTQNTLNISFGLNEPQEIEIKIFNSIGQQMLDIKEHAYSGINKYAADLSRFHNGMYIVQIKAGQQILTSRILKY